MTIITRKIEVIDMVADMAADMVAGGHDNTSQTHDNVNPLKGQKYDLSVTLVKNVGTMG